MSIQQQEKRVLQRGGFTFKQFFVAHDRCAMKVGTDGVLLGGWATLPCFTSAPESSSFAQTAQLASEHSVSSHTSEARILDIGSGSGLIALMLAQRSHAAVQIDAVELDTDAAAQAQENFAASPWHHRLHLYAQDILRFSQNRNQAYDLIVSNPPYFAPAVACRDAARTTARYTGSLDHPTLLACARQLIAPAGQFCVVLPYAIGNEFMQLALANGWYCVKRLTLNDRPDKPYHRLLLALTRQPVDTQEHYFSLRDSDGEYSQEFRQLISPFYLNY